MTYAAGTSKSKQRKFQSIGIQTECFTNSNSVSLTNFQTQPQINEWKKKSQKDQLKQIHQSLLQIKLLLHKKTVENTLNKKQLEKQGRKLNSQNLISNASKSIPSHNNPSKKVKTNEPINKAMKKETNSTTGTDLYPFIPLNLQKMKIPCELPLPRGRGHFYLKKENDLLHLLELLWF